MYSIEDICSNEKRKSKPRKPTKQNKNKYIRVDTFTDIKCLSINRKSETFQSVKIAKFIFIGWIIENYTNKTEYYIPFKKHLLPKCSTIVTENNDVIISKIFFLNFNSF
jgi:hypothetical protein